MNITLLCSDPGHPVNAYIERWIQHNREEYRIELARTREELKGGDILFLVSCTEIVGSAERNRYRVSLVLHASDLPKGRGWSPHVWDIINGAGQLTVTLLEAEDKIDSGRIWSKVAIDIPSHFLWDEINEKIFAAEIELIDVAVRELDRIMPRAQDKTTEPTYYRRRTLADSRIDPALSIAEQFDLIRICDPGRYPAHFELRGQRYKLTLEKLYD
jgi:methionyl-tRNA formyltransferase